MIVFFAVSKLSTVELMNFSNTWTLFEMEDKVTVNGTMTRRNDSGVLS